ncbi:MAG: GGDEF domain-containing protein [Gammaproteobacteria bacterium SHHR-1]|uniref:GGDEF domain-containing protein n=1 Tax=Magnetovirga frankeli TaxID=947516 RepID=UPI001AF97DF8|nr:GGDEF domain-containing protein [gamma proteobacterium SS-5]
MPLALIIKQLEWLLGASELSSERLTSLLSRRFHSAYFSRYRRILIYQRIRVISALFALLTLAWIPIDWLLLPTQTALGLTGLRLLSAGLFLFLALTDSQQSEPCQFRLTLLFINPLLFYLAALNQLQGLDVAGWGQYLAEVYGLLPFIALAGLCIFPLTLLESLGLGLLPLLATLVSPVLVSDPSQYGFISHGWMLVLILGVTLLATSIQLNFMLSLLHRISYDPLTRVFSRSTGNELIDLYFHLSLDQESPFALAFVDLDRFKSINDDYGHEMGDEALRNAAHALGQQFRRSDMVIRWGGEEFLVIFPNTDMAGVRLVLERLSQNWLGQRPDGAPLTASIGVAERLSDGINDWPQLLELADKRMYQAKQTGRAKVVLNAEQEIRSPQTEGGS